MAKYKIGYIDEQESEIADFINAIEDVEEGQESIFSVIPILVTEETIFEELVDLIISEKFDCLVVDYELSETGVTFEGSKIIYEFKRRMPFYPTLVYTAKESKAIQNLDYDLALKVFDKSIKDDNQKLANFKQRIISFIEGHRAKIDATQSQLYELTNIQEKGKLSAEQEQEFLRLNRINDELNGNGMTTIGTFLSSATTEKFSELIAKTEELLSKLDK